ncbi:hypothetical protein GQF42_44525 [Streptomyces broussonetiae]|uniref:Secreted protein n=1 Tax=Streptomyces broussonetiae TaxID=2686304 RepID=A0A6I6NG31_9ACTN|nr:hypothetical protein [Streptomyces broussonetiae]QHA09301.1 hypothetical protein GQF42_44525 [Streptomyces broussonetiae]
MPVRTPVSRRFLVLLVAAGAMTAACGHEPASHGPDTSAVQSSPPDSAASSAAASTRSDGIEEARQKAERERRQAAPPGVTITPSPVTGIAKGSEHFGTPVISQGDVTVYAARREKGGLTVPVEVVNSGRKRAFYRFRIRITGPGGFDATASASSNVVGLYPGTSWPTELTVSDPGHTPPSHPHITIESVERNEYKA